MNGRTAAPTAATATGGPDLVADLFDGMQAERNSFPAGPGRDGYEDGAAEQMFRLVGLLRALRRHGTSTAAETARQDAADHVAAARIVAVDGGLYETAYLVGANAACTAVDRILSYTIAATRRPAEVSGTGDRDRDRRSSINEALLHVNEPGRSG